MKTWKNIFAPLLILVAFTACNEDDTIDDILAPGPSFSMDKFEQNIQDAYYNDAVGISYALSLNGQLKRSGAHGKAQTGPDGNINMSVHTRANIASVSKLVTTVAALKIIEDTPGLDVNDAIGPYLPVNWNPSAAFQQITFRQLLRHESGLHIPNAVDGEDDQDFANLKQIAETQPIGSKSYDYTNIGFSFFRVLIPHMLGDVQLSTEISSAVIYAVLYENYVQNEILKPIGINAASQAQGPDDALLYRFPYDNSSGVNPGDWKYRSGAGGWYMSAYQMANFIAYVWHSEDLISTNSRNMMNSNWLGLSETVTNGDHGNYPAKGGALNYSNPTKGVRTLVISYPNGVQASIILNSADDPYWNLNAVLRDAFDDAWE